MSMLTTELQYQGSVAIKKRIERSQWTEQRAYKKKRGTKVETMKFDKKSRQVLSKSRC